MALVVGQATVATGMSPVVEGGLYADEIFQDGVTFTSEHDIGNAGQIQVEVYSPDNSIEPKTPGADFTNSEYANTVIDINTNNSFQKSQKVPAYVQATMPTSVLLNKTWAVTEDIRIARQKTGLAVLATEGTASADTDAITSANIKEKVLALRKELRKKHARPDVVLASVDAYSSMLETAGKDYTPVSNDSVVATGRVGYWMGMLWVEATLLGGSFKYNNASGVAQTVDTSDIELIMYDHMAYSIIDKLVMLRTIDNPNAAGSLVQEEVDSGFKVTNAACVSVKKKLSESGDIESGSVATKSASATAHTLGK